MATHMLLGVFLVAWGVSAASGVNSRQPAQSAVIVIHAFDEGLAGVRAANPAVHLSVARDSSVTDERVLIVDYPAPTDDPAGVTYSAPQKNRTGPVGARFHFRSSRTIP